MSCDCFSVNAMSVSVDSVFSPEDHNLPKTGIVSMKNTSASLEALMTGGIKVSIIKGQKCCYGYP